jgi:hypothetical protein
MNIEKISRIELSEDNKLKVFLSSEGRTEYQYIYREAAGVHWYQEEGCFSSTPIKDWTVKRWFRHILDITRKTGVLLELGSNTQWVNIEQSVILNPEGE